MLSQGSHTELVLSRVLLAAIAQGIELLFPKQRVVGSNPTSGTKPGLNPGFLYEWENFA